MPNYDVAVLTIMDGDLKPEGVVEETRLTVAVLTIMDGDLKKTRDLNTTEQKKSQSSL